MSNFMHSDFGVIFQELNFVFKTKLILSDIKENKIDIKIGITGVVKKLTYVFVGKHKNSIWWFIENSIDIWADEYDRLFCL